MTGPRRVAPGLAAWLMLMLTMPCVSAGGDDTLAAPDSPPVVLIVVDTLRADHLGPYGYRRFTTPELDAYARQGAVFEHAYAPSPWTLPSMASLFTGLLPAQHGAGALMQVGNKTLYAKLRDGLPVLAGRFHAFGYPTHVIAGNPNLHPRFGLLAGFDTVDFRAGDMQVIRRADVIVDRAIQWMRGRRGAPFFLFLHFFDPHMNYDPPPPVRGRFTTGLAAGRLSLPFAESGRVRSGRLWLSKAEQDFVAAAYDEEIVFVDMQLGRLFAAMHATGLWGRAIVVVTADHGEELWDHNGFEHGHTMYDELLHVPLMMWGPGIAAGRIDAPVSLVDVPPTLLAAVGAAPLPDPAGLSLWPLLTRGAPLAARPLIASSARYGPDRVAAIHWPHKAIVNLEDGSERLFDLAQDPRERVNLSAAQPDTMAALRREIDAGSAARHGRATTAAVKLDDATREQLRSLGYLE